MANKRRVLAVGLSADEFTLVEPYLDVREFEVDRFPSAEGALELAARRELEALLVRYPLPGMDLGSFLEAVRQESSPSLHSPLVLLTDAERCGQAERFIGRGANRVVCLDDTRQIQQTLVDLLYVAPRQATRFFVQLEAHSGEAHGWILCRAENCSATGVLLATDQQLAAGTRVNFEFTLPAVAEPVIGEAEVARHTFDGRDPVAGMGIRILSFDGDSQRVYQEFLDGLAD